jgi:hypothetical protein
MYVEKAYCFNDSEFRHTSEQSRVSGPPPKFDGEDDGTGVGVAVRRCKEIEAAFKDGEEDGNEEVMAAAVSLHLFGC